MKISITIEADITEQKGVPQSLTLQEIMGEEADVDVIQAVKFALEDTMLEISDKYHISVQVL